MDSSRPQLHIDTHNGSNVVMRLIVDLSIEHNGNHITSVSDAVDESLDYEGAFDFADGDDKDREYSYNGNGALTMDLNKGIQNIEYDLLGNPKKITLSGGRTIEYVYSADGRRLRTKHYQELSVREPKRPGKNSTTVFRILTDSIDYVGNLILKNGKPQMYQFAGGYYYFDGDKKPECHYYVQDYQGNNRMVVNAHTDFIEQVTHYYPFGGVMADISIGQDLQKYKYGNKELDRTYGLDLYDFHARQYDAIMPSFTSIDPMAEKYYSISPYAYCAGNPVNLIDPTGENYYYADSTGHIFLALKCEESKLFANDPNNSDGIVHMDLENDDIMEGLRVQDFEKGEGFKVKGYNNHQVVTSSPQALDVFNFLAQNTAVEWGFSQDDEGNSYIGTYHSKKQAPANGLNVTNSRITLMVHSHARLTEDSSDIATDDDLKTAAKYPNAKHYMVSRKNKKIVKFNGTDPNQESVVFNKKNFRYGF